VFGEEVTTRRIVTLAALCMVIAVACRPEASVPGSGVGAVAARSLDGSGDNLGHPAWGEAGTQYLRVAAPNYADGLSQMVIGPSPRYISNRIFNDQGQNLFSENGVSQWGWVWGQFIDHDIGLRDETSAQSAPIPFDAHDPLEAFTNDLGTIEFSRTPAAAGTGVTSLRQQINTVSSYIDGSAVYGVDPQRLEWLREGPVDGNLADNGALLMLPGGYLPGADARGDPGTAPSVDLFGGLAATPQLARVAGDVRANENVALLAVQTLFAREHDRIVAELPSNLSEDEKFQIARRIVGAEIQFITYHEFLPALGVRLDPYRGYDPNVDAGVSNEFATVGYRAHSMVHGQFDVRFRPGAYSAAQLDAFRAQGVGIRKEDGRPSLQIPLTVAFGNPELLPQVGLGRLLRSLSQERQYRNDEQIDNSLRSVLFQIPSPGMANPSACGQPVVQPGCFTGVEDLGAIDIERGRDHGIPSYNDLRRAYGLAPRRTFTAITGEATARFPSDPTIDRADPIDDPSILDFIRLRDRDGHVLQPLTARAQEEAVTGIRRTTLAARLKAIYGSVDRIDAFVGMLSERHVPGTEFGPLQLAMWKKQFEALRDGDRFFYLNDPDLARIDRTFGITYRHSLADLIALNTGTSVQPDVFKVAASDA
jgi:hypothetical protein